MGRQSEIESDVSSASMKFDAEFITWLKLFGLRKTITTMKGVTVDHKQTVQVGEFNYLIWDFSNLNRFRSCTTWYSDKTWSFLKSLA